MAVFGGRGRWWIVAVVVLLAGCGGGGGSSDEDGSGAEAAYYDRFSGPTLSGAKWSEGARYRNVELEPGGAGTPAELVLRSRIGNGRAGHSYDVQLNTPEDAAPLASLDAIQADMKLVAADLAGAARARAALEMHFQAAAYRGASDQDLYIARIELRDNNDGNGPHVAFNVIACADALCLNQHVVSENRADLIVAGTDFAGTGITLDTWYSLGIALSGGSIVFSFDGSTASWGPMGAYPGFQADAFRLARLRARVQTQADGAGGQVAARARNVMITPDGGSATDYALNDGAAIHASNWREGALDVDLADGRLVLDQTQGERGHIEQVSMRAPEGVARVSALARVQAYDGSGGGSPRAFLAGAFYNDGTAGDMRGRRNGDIVAVIGLSGTAAGYRVLRCVTAGCAIGTREELAAGVVAQGLTAGEVVALSVGWTGTRFQFRAGNQSATYTPAAAEQPLHPLASVPWVSLGTRVANDAGQSGSIRAAFDDVQVTPRDSVTGQVAYRLVDAFEGPRLNGVVWKAAGGSVGINGNGDAIRVSVSQDAMRAGENYTHTLALDDSAGVIGMKADVQMLSTGTGATATGSAVRAFVELAYQPEAAWNAGVDTGWVGARMELRMRVTGYQTSTVEAYGYVSSCADAACTTPIAEVQSANQGSPYSDVEFDITYQLAVAYDSANDRFDFAVQNSEGTDLASWQVDLSDAVAAGVFDAANLRRAALRARATGSGANPGGFAVGTVEWDDVEVDTGSGLTAYDVPTPFDDNGTARIDTDKWLVGDMNATPSSITQLTLGRSALVLGHRHAHQASSARAHLPPGGSIVALAADVALASGGTTAETANIDERAQIGGTFFNSGQGSAGGHDGDVFAVMELDESSIDYLVQHCTSADCGTNDEIAGGSISITGNVLPFTNYYRLSVRFLEERFDFRVYDPDDGTLLGSATVDVPAGVPLSGLPGRPRHFVGTRISGSGLDGSTMAGAGGLFDNVVVGRRQ